MVGGACVNTGTIPSKTLRETVLYLTGLSQREVYGQSYRGQERHHDGRTLSGRTAQVVSRDIQVVQDQLARNRVKLIFGPASFVDEHTVMIRAEDRQDEGHRRTHRHRDGHEARRGRRTWPSTARRSWTPTASWTSIASRRRWSSSGPASSASSTRRSSRPSAARSRSSSGATGCSSSATKRSSRRCSITCAGWR